MFDHVRPASWLLKTKVHIISNFFFLLPVCRVEHTYKHINIHTLPLTHYRLSISLTHTPIHIISLSHILHTLSPSDTHVHIYLHTLILTVTTHSSESSLSLSFKYTHPKNTYSAFLLLFLLTRKKKNKDFMHGTIP